MFCPYAVLLDAGLVRYKLGSTKIQLQEHNFNVPDGEIPEALGTIACASAIRKRATRIRRKRAKT